MNRITLICTLFFFSFLFLDCKTEPKPKDQEQTTNPVEEPKKQGTIPRFSKDSAYAFIQKQVNFGPRVPGSEGHKACKEWIVEKMNSYGAEVIEQDFTANIYTGDKWPATNIIAQFNPTQKKRILLAAHWDTRFLADQDADESRRDEPILGADDGGSGVGVLLEVARNLANTPIDMGVDIVFFDAEDQGYNSYRPGDGKPKSWGLGAQYWSANLHKKGYRPAYGILLDMVGSDGARFTKEQVSMEFAPEVVEKVWGLAKTMGYGSFFIDEETGGVTDDHFFVNTIAKIPMIDIINKAAGSSSGFGPYWHTHNDNLSVINRRTLRSVGQVILAVTYKESWNAL